MAGINRLCIVALDKLGLSLHQKGSSLVLPSAEGVLSIGLSVDFVLSAVTLDEEFSSEGRSIIMR